MSSSQLKSGLSERILAILDWSGMSQTKLSKLLSVPQATLNRRIRESDNDLFQHVPDLLRLFPDVNPSWLWSNDGPMLRADVTLPTGLCEDEVTLLTHYRNSPPEGKAALQAAGAALAKAKSPKAVG